MRGPTDSRRAFTDLLVLLLFLGLFGLSPKSDVLDRFTALGNEDTGAVCLTFTEVCIEFGDDSSVPGDVIKVPLFNGFSFNTGEISAFIRGDPISVPMLEGKGTIEAEDASISKLDGCSHFDEDSAAAAGGGVSCTIEDLPLDTGGLHAPSSMACPPSGCDSTAFIIARSTDVGGNGVRWIGS